MHKRSTSINIRVLPAMVLLLFSASVFLVFTLANSSERALTEQLRARMSDIAASAASLLDGDEIGGLTADDTDKPEYQRALKTLSASSTLSARKNTIVKST